MKIQATNNYSYNRNTNFKGINKFCKHSIGSLIAATSLFMLSNALDTFKSEKISNNITQKIDFAASLMAIAGTALGIFGIEKQEENNENR